MVTSTRTRTGAITKVSYDTKTLRLRGEAKPVDVPKRRRTDRSTRRWRETNKAWFDWAFQGADIPPGMDTGIVTSKPAEESIPTFDMPVIIGEVEREGMSAIQRANQLIQQLDELKAVHEKHMPRAVPGLILKLEDAKEARAKLKNDKENNSVINESKRGQAVQDRIEVLENALADSEFEPERKNIKCAINGYKSGLIPYRDRYTLIWAGRIVDVVDTYADFSSSEERPKRLDKYLKAYGPGFLWYERGLKESPWHKPRASRATELSREMAHSGLGQYFVNQCFTKRAGWVSRMPQMFQNPACPLPEEVTKDWKVSEDGRLFCQQEGPRIAYQSLLDSGATFPSLDEADFELLGVERNAYAAQTIESLGTANGISHQRCYEMHVTVLTEKGQEMVDPDTPAWPYHGKYLGGLMPVIAIPSKLRIPDAEGRLQVQRLSGVMAFLACYISTVPARNKLWLGEDRNDVLGAHRMPGQRRWDISMPSGEPEGAKGWSAFGEPKVAFSHLHGQVIDRDRPELLHASQVIVNEGLPNQFFFDSWPRGQCLALRNEGDWPNQPVLPAPVTAENARKNLHPQRPRKPKGPPGVKVPPPDDQTAAFVEPAILGAPPGPVAFVVPPVPAPPGGSGAGSGA